MTAPTVESVFDIPGDEEKWATTKLPRAGWFKDYGHISIKPDDISREPKTVIVTAWKHDEAPGLMYHRMHNTKEIAYAITHIGTGLRCGPIALSHAEARRALAAMAKGLDWSQDSDTIKHSSVYRERFGKVTAAFVDSVPPWMPWMRETGWKG